MDESLRQFCKRLNELLPTLTRAFTRRENELTKGKITVPQFVILELLHRRGECIMTELAHYLSVTTSAVTGLIDRLIKLDLVNRKRDQGDRRIVKITLTKKGREAIEKILRQRQKMMADIFGSLSEKDREKYLEILEKVSRILTSKIEKEK